MKIPDGIPFDCRDDYRNGYADGYNGRDTNLPRHFSMDSFMNGGTGQVDLPPTNPRVRAYLRGYDTGKEKLSKLKGGL